MRILHLADLHLDRPFVGLPIEAARERRRELRAALDRCLDLARERDAAAITIGGDLWEDEHVTPDTLRWTADRLGGTGLPVVIVAGNHDPLSPGGPYDRAGFREGVSVLPSDQGLVECNLGDVSIWGVSWHSGRPLTADFLADFQVPDDGRKHVLLVHGTCGAYFEGTTHCPFDSTDVRSAGFDLCLAGHLHGAGVRDDLVVYPGSPEPLAWSETGRHAVAIVDLGGPTPAVELVDSATRRYAEVSVDCSAADSSAEIERRVRVAIAQQGDGRDLCLRVRLAGRVDPGCSVDVEALQHGVPETGLAMAEFVDQTAVAFDLEAIAKGTGVSAVFVQRMQERLAEQPEDATTEEALHLGLRALHGEQL